jgi:hypothetical protein
MSESFYVAGDVASIGFFNQPGGINLGVKMVLPAGTISAGRWFYPDQPVSPLVWRLYDSAGSSVLAGALPDAVTQQVFVTFSTAASGLPLHVAAGTYWSVIESNAPYSAIPGFYSGGAVTRGDLTFGASAFVAPPPPAFPGNSSNAAYMNDIVFTPDGGARSPAADFMPFFL